MTVYDYVTMYEHEYVDGYRAPFSSTLPSSASASSAEITSTGVGARRVLCHPGFPT